MGIITDKNTLITSFNNERIAGANLNASVMRLDLMDAYINGNKWFKLKHQLQDALQRNCTHIVTFGGVWSNHVIATAAACNAQKLACTVYIRSDEKLWTQTLVNAQKLGARIEFVGRTEYRQLKTKQGVDVQNPTHYFIAEGGMHALGVLGAQEILEFDTLATFTHILCPIGTGTTFAGLINKALPHQQIIGINALKGGSFQESIIRQYTNKDCYAIVNDYHFGGFAKYDGVLIAFMRNWYTQTKIPTDIVYTGKMFYALMDLVQKNYFPSNANLLMIHTGGLQGNASLENGVLNF